jgi:hypothetical protein
MRSASATTAHRLSRTTSSNFLSRAVQLDSFQRYRNELFRQERSSLGFEDAVFDCCRFIGIKSPSNSGGAVMSVRTLVIFNCLFENCLGRHGGAVACHGRLDLHFTTAGRCVARREGGAIVARSQGWDSLTISESQLNGCKAGNFGTMYRLSPGDLNLTGVNISKSHADSCVGCFESKRGVDVLKRLIVTESRALAHNGALCLREAQSIDIAQCIFAKCQHQSAESNAAAVLLIYDSPLGAKLQNCVFSNNRHDASYTLTVASGGMMTIKNCCFTGDRAREINPKLLTPESCLFDQPACTEVTVGTIRGYDQAITPRVLEKGVTPTSEIVLRKRRRTEFILGTSAGLAAASAAVLTCLQMTATRWVAARKRPRAFQ